MIIVFLSVSDCWESTAQGRPPPSRCWQETLAPPTARLRSVTLTGNAFPLKSAFTVPRHVWNTKTLLQDVCVGLHSVLINLNDLCPQENGGHHRLQEGGHKHRLLPPGGRSRWPYDRRGASLFLRPRQGHFQERNWPGKVTSVTKSFFVQTKATFWSKSLTKSASLCIAQQSARRWWRTREELWNAPAVWIYFFIF